MLTPAEASDRLAIRERFDAYAHRADRREAERQKVAWPRHLDVLVRVGGAWLFAERELYVDWTETRPSPAR